MCDIKMPLLRKKKNQCQMRKEQRREISKCVYFYSLIWKSMLDILLFERHKVLVKVISIIVIAY